MKALKLKLLFCSLIILAISSSFTSGTDMSFRIKDGEVYVNGKMIKKAWPFKGFSAILGKQDRTQGGRVEIYDNVGLLLYRHNTHKKNITEIQVRFSNEDHDDINTNAVFPGSVLIDDFSLSKDLTPAKVTTGLSAEWHKESCSLDHEIKMQYKHTYIYFKFNAEENQLTMIAVGRDND